MNTKVEQAETGLLDILACPIVAGYMKNKDETTQNIYKLTLDIYLSRDYATHEQVASVKSAISEAFDEMVSERESGESEGGKVSIKHVVISFASFAVKLLIKETDITLDFINHFNRSKEIFYETVEEMKKVSSIDDYESDKQKNVAQITAAFKATQASGEASNIAGGIDVNLKQSDQELAHEVITMIVSCPVILSINQSKKHKVCSDALNAAYAIAIKPSSYKENIHAIEEFYSQAFEDANRERNEARSQGQDCCDHSMNTYNLVAHALYSAVRVVYDKEEATKALRPHFMGYIKFFTDEHNTLINTMIKDPNCEVEAVGYKARFEYNLDSLKKDAQKAIDDIDNKSDKTVH
jgi:hypothetical protein